MLQLHVTDSAAVNTPHFQPLNHARQLEKLLSGHMPPDAIERLIQVTMTQWRETHHGDQGRWEEAFQSICTLLGDGATQPGDKPYVVDGGTVKIAQTQSLQRDTKRQLYQHLQALIPWRKGPWQLAGVDIDTEWRSDWKWDRLAPHISSLDGRCVLDVGCGNGYHLWRMHAAGAALTVGIDPGLLFNYQFNVLQHFSNVDSILLLPLTLEQFPHPMPFFDTVFSMGVLSHRREPRLHIDALRRTMKPHGELVLETLVAPPINHPEQGLSPCQIEGRYARMRNVWQLPDIPVLTHWLKSCGFVDIECVSDATTSTEEQRTTEWMPFQSLADALDPADPSLTIEGYPAPRRAIMIARNGDQI